MISRELLLQATALLRDAGCDSPRLDAELLLMHAWHINKTDLIIKMNDPVPENVEKHFHELQSRRKKREPVAYILGEKEFWSRPFMVDPRVLIPRPETEHLIEELLRLYPDRTMNYRFCDIGTGSGCIACTVASEFPNAAIVATDISNNALEVAKSNAGSLNVAERMTFRCGDMFSALDLKTPRFDAIVSNPPYVSQKEMEQLEPELDFEPRSALTDEDNGLTYLSILFDQCKEWLEPGGYLIVETGICGLPETPSHLKLIEHYHDLAGIKRGAIYRL
ncbi:MAG: peptide chain release factor N(5)-glutamine methyltransferase [Mariprofundaceae bacterium]